MSDAGLPPPPRSSSEATPGAGVPGDAPPDPPPAMPPPPPPGLTAPPGYVAFANQPTPVGYLARVGGIAKWTMIVTAAAGIAGFAGSILLLPVLDKASGFLDGTVSEDDFNDAYLASQLLGTLGTVVGLGAAVFTMVWMYRISTNLRVCSRQTTFHPLFAIFGWFLPPFLFVLPLLVLRELWKASDPNAVIGDEHWRSGPVNPLLYVWFVARGVVPAVIQVVVLYHTLDSILDGGLFAPGDSTRLTAETLDAAGQFTVVSGVITLVQAVLWIVFIKQLTTRHIELTGEA